MSEMIHPPLINKVYLAGPLECCSRGSALSWREDVEKQLRERGNILSLIPGFDSTDNEPDSINWLDFSMIEQAEATIINLTYLGEVSKENVKDILIDTYAKGSNLDSVVEDLVNLFKKGIGTGTLCEVGYAKKCSGKLIVGYTEKPWLSENRFLRGILTRLFDNRQAAIDYLIGFNNRKELKKVM
jgi:nucleoside 2-deoxyribosyltransferase